MSESFERLTERSESEIPVRLDNAAGSADAAGSVDNGAHRADPVVESKLSPVAAKTLPEASATFFSATESQEFRSRWDAAQTNFVDEPRKSVEEADNLVAAVIKRLSEVFSNERQNLEGQWEKGDNVSTEDLRVALQRYRSFFSRLLSA